MHTLLRTLAIIALCAPAALGQNSGFDWVKIGNPGNSPDPGAVDYEYYMSTTEVTNAQYAEFLNAVDPTGANGKSLWNPAMQTCNFPVRGCTAGIRKRSLPRDGHNYEVIAGYDLKPVTHVSWYSAIRYINWMNLQVLDSDGLFSMETEAGAYVILESDLGPGGVPMNGQSIVRYSNPSNPNDPFPYFVLPTLNEWYKAAYHDAFAGEAGLYFRYANGSNVSPVSDQPWQSPAGANYYNDDGLTNGFNDGYAVFGSRTVPFLDSNPLTDVGAYSSTVSTYGILDQNGNVAEWTESRHPLALPDQDTRIYADSSWRTEPARLDSDDIVNVLSQRGAGSNLGFRVAALPSYFEDFRLTVQYATPSVVEGPLVEGFDPLPATITAEFMLEDVALDDYTVGLDQVTDFHLSGAPFGMTNAMDLDSFYLELDDNTREPRTLNWSLEDLVAKLIILNNNFQLNIRGTDAATQQPFRYFWATSTNTFEAVAELQGDYNSDGAVNAADYVVWRDGLGSTYTPVDYEVWRSNYGRQSATLATAERIQPAPEPAGVSLLTLAAGLCQVLCPARGRRSPV